MFEFLSGFFLGYMFNIPMLIGLIIIGFLFETNEKHGMALFLIICASLLAVFLFKVSLTTIGIIAAAYIPTGLVWSVWRYKQYVGDAVQKAMNSSVQERRYLQRELRPSSMLEKITAWTMLWPFSFLESFLGDLIRLVQHTITKWLGNIYTNIFNSAINKLNIPTDTE